MSCEMSFFPASALLEESHSDATESVHGMKKLKRKEKEEKEKKENERKMGQSLNIDNIDIATSF